jgi:hypothetical protein
MISPARQGHFNQHAKTGFAHIEVDGLVNIPDSDAYVSKK